MPVCAEKESMANYAYVDDSGSEPSQPVYVLGGLILPEETWRDFATDWNRVLTSNPAIAYFKGSEVWDKRKGPFKDFSTRERAEKVDSLADVVFAYKPLSISTRVEWDVYRRFSSRFNLDAGFDDPYFFLFFSLIAQVLILGRQHAQFSNVSFVFDEQGRIGTHARLWYLAFLTYCTRALESQLGRWPESGDEKIIVQLQAADMFAWYQRRSVLGSLGHESHQRIWQRFEEFQSATIVRDTNLEKIATDLRFPRNMTE